MKSGIFTRQRDAVLTLLSIKADIVLTGATIRSKVRERRI